MSIGLMKQIESLYSVGVVVGLTDGQLLGRFVNRRGEPAAEAAFAALVDRHGPMVLRVCRRILGDEHAGEDASQAVFLILSRRSEAIANRESIGSWLYGVALRVASKARVAASRRRLHECRGGEIVADRRSREPGGSDRGEERWTELFEELERLPESFRAPIVLCYLEGQTQEQAAAQLRWPLGTVQSRLARGRSRLKVRLSRRGAGPSLGLLGPIATPRITAAPAAWAETTLRLAMIWGGNDGSSATGSIHVGAGPAPMAAVLAGEVLRGMFVHKLKLALWVLLIAVASAAGSRAWTGSGTIPSASGNLHGKAGPDEAQDRPIDARAKVDGPGVAITGWVAGPDGQPLAGARLESPILNIREKTVTTGPDGRFTITADEVPRNEFALRIDAPEMASKMFTIVAEPRPLTTAPLGPAPTVYPMEPSGLIGRPLEMDRGSVVTGRVVREGKPVPAATIGLWRDVHGYDAMLGSPEVKTDAEGRFRFPHAPADARCWIYVATGSLERPGAVPPSPLRTPGRDLSVDLGDLMVRPGRTLSGRVVFSDGKPLPANAEIVVSADHAGGSLRTGFDQRGRFTVAGLPDGQVEIVAYFPDDKMYAPAGYHVSSRNKCLDPLNPWRLVGRLDHDISDLTILFEPGPQPSPRLDPTSTSASKAAQAGPITGVPEGE